MRQRLGRSGRGEDEPHVLRMYIVEEEVDPRSSVSDRLRVELFQTTAMVELMVRQAWTGGFPRSDRWLRVFNEISVLVFIAILWAVIFKPF